MSSYKIGLIEGIGAVNARSLSSAGVTTTGKLLDRCASAKGRAALAAATGLSERMLLKWTNMADLMRVKGVGEEYSELLEAAGVDTVRELKTRRPDNLTRALAAANAKRNLVRQIPAESMVTRWIAHAKSLPSKITH